MFWSIVKTIFWLAVLAGVGAAVYQAVQEQPLEVDFSQSERGSMEVTVFGEGTVQVKETHIVSAPLSGSMERISAEVGDPVVAGETVLARLREAPPALLNERERVQGQADVRAAEAALELAAADKERVTAELANAKTLAERTAKLVERGVFSQEKLDVDQTRVATLEAELHRADAEISLRENQIAKARASLITTGADSAEGRCCVEIVSSVDGHVLHVLHKDEGVVVAGAELIEIGDIDDLEASIELLSTDAVRVRQGAPALLDAWGGDDALAGTVRLVEPVAYSKVSALGIEEQRVHVLLDFDEPEAGGGLASLGHGYRIEANIVIWQEDDVLKVPVSTLFRERGSWSVFVVQDGATARLRPVEVGQVNNTEAQILGGLEAGETLVSYPPSRLKDGDLVQPRGI